SAAETAGIHIPGIIGLTIKARLWIGIPENLCQIPVIFVLPLIAGLLQSNPGVLAPIHQRGRVRIRREQVAEGWPSIMLERRINGVEELRNCDAFLNDIEVDGAQNRIVRLVTGEYVLDVT